MSEKTIAFLHTAAVHQPTFGALMARLAPDIALRHLNDESLLADAMAGADVTARLEGRLQELAADRPDLIVCSCSTLGGPAETVGRALGLRVMRIDRAMAEQAVAGGGRILVAACIASTIEPTLALLRAVAERPPDIESLVIEGAWDRFLASDLAGYHGAIAAGLRAAAQGQGVEVVVLAQASMAPAAALCQDLGIPILSSPEIGVRRAIDLVAAG